MKKIYTIRENGFTYPTFYSLREARKEARKISKKQNTIVFVLCYDSGERVAIFNNGNLI